jgi:transcriptional regulator with XRE-family HTH domain
MKEATISKEAMLVVKNRAKSLGITQSDIAQYLNVSLPTVKRWYSGSGVNIEILKNICDVIEVSLSDVFTMVESNEGNQFTYTDTQEKFFSKNPHCLAFFDYLVRGFSVSRIQKKFSLPRVELEKILNQLEKLELIDWLPGNKAKLKVSGEPAWISGGPLSNKFRESILNSFVNGHNKKNTKFLLHDYLDSDFNKIKSKLDELLEFASIANRRAKSSADKSKNYGFYISLKGFNWDMDCFLSEKRND